MLEHVQRATVAKAAEVMDQAVRAGTDDDLASYDARAAVSEITAKLGSLERLMASLDARLSQLERRPQAAPAPAAMPAQTVAKAPGAPRRPKTQEEIAEQLLSDVDAYIDSPSTVGTLSSMVHAGKFAEVQRILAGARRSHEAARLVNERKGFSQT